MHFLTCQLGEIFAYDTKAEMLQRKANPPLFRGKKRLKHLERGVEHGTQADPFPPLRLSGYKLPDNVFHSLFCLPIR